jgi:WD40 repeat protein
VQIYTPDGRRVANYTPHDWDQTRSLGVSLVRWSPSSQFLAVASHDHKVRFLNNYTWQSLIELTIPRTVSSDECHAFTETFGGESEEIAKIRSDVHYDAAQTSTNLPTAKQSGENKLHLSISSLSWNISGNLVAIKDDLTPTTCVIFDLFQLKVLSVLVHLSPVRVMQWNPQRPSVLAIACQNSSNVYIWNGESCSCYPVPMGKIFR